MATAGPSCCSSSPAPAAGPATWPAAGRPASRRPSWPDGGRSGPSPVQELAPVLEEAAAALGDQDPPLLASLARELAWNGIDLARASRLADEAMAAARGTGDRVTLGACLVARHNAGWGPQNAAARLALAGRVAELAGREDPEPLAEARLLAATDRLELADPRFQRELAEFLRVAADLGQPRLRYAALARRAAQGLLAGRLDQAERLTVEAADLGRAIGEPDVADVEQAQLWELRSLQGRRAELLPQVRAVFGDHSPQGSCLQAMILLERGDRAAAEAVAAPLLDSAAPEAFPADRNWTLAATFASELAAALKVRPACQWLYDALGPLAGGAAVVGAAIAFRGAVDHYLGLLAASLGRPEPARGHFERAVAVHDRLGARTWALRSRYELALVLPAPADAAPVLTEVVSEAGRLGMTELARQAAGQRPAAEAALVAGDVFRRDGTLWTLRYAGRTVRMRDAKGLRDLATLLRSPGRPVRAADLVAGADAAVSAELRMGPTRCWTTGPARSSAPACSTWRPRSRRPAAGTTRSGRPGRPWSGTRWWPSWPPRAASAAGPGGSATSPSARKTVTARIRDVIDRVERVHPALGAHLRASVTTGTFCSYSPPAPTAWEL